MSSTPQLRSQWNHKIPCSRVNRTCSDAERRDIDQNFWKLFTVSGSKRNTSKQNTLRRRKRNWKKIDLNRHVHQDYRQSQSKASHIFHHRKALQSIFKFVMKNFHAIDYSIDTEAWFMLIVLLLLEQSKVRTVKIELPHKAKSSTGWTFLSICGILVWGEEWKWSLFRFLVASHVLETIIRVDSERRSIRVKSAKSKSTENSTNTPLKSLKD